MKSLRDRVLFLIVTLFVAAIVAACSGVPEMKRPHLLEATSHAGAASKRTLRPFRSDEELRGFFRKLSEEQKKRRERGAAGGNMNAQATPTAGAADMATTAKSEAQKSKDESVTNVQQAGVDEGGIVKLHGDYLVMLRRGRLFTVQIGDGALKPVSVADAFGPEIDPAGTWYDEMLVSEDTVAVIGYSYQRGGTEIGLFN
nr:beta-propeller domain-containing protein [Acidobacteriota bacterium]